MTTYPAYQLPQCLTESWQERFERTRVQGQLHANGIPTSCYEAGYFQNELLPVQNIGRNFDTYASPILPNKPLEPTHHFFEQIPSDIPFHLKPYFNTHSVNLPNPITPYQLPPLPANALPSQKYAYEQALKTQHLLFKTKQNEPKPFVFDPNRPLNLGTKELPYFEEQSNRLYFESFIGGDIPRFGKNKNIERLIEMCPKSQILNTQGLDHPGATFVTINGIFNGLDCANAFGEYITNISGHKTYVLHNASQSNWDFVELDINRKGIVTPPVALCINFILQHCEHFPDKEIYFACHSQGAGILKAALNYIPEKYRDRLVVRTYGASDYIPETLCRDTINYVNSKDFISRVANIFTNKKNCNIVCFKSMTNSAIKEHNRLNIMYSRQLEMDFNTAIKSSKEM